MIILGIDPGFDRIGWAVGQQLSSGRLNLLSFGLIETDKKLDLMTRYAQIDEQISGIIRDFPIKEAALESLFFFKNQKTVITVAQARGVMLASLLRAGIKIAEYSPPQIKSSVTGFGRADKKAIEKMVRQQLHLDDFLVSQKIAVLDDTFDAMAVLLTHAAARHLQARLPTASR